MISVPIWLCIVIALICAAVCAGIAFLLGIEHRKKEAESAIGSAEQEAKRIVSDAIKTAEARKKEVVLEGKDEIHRSAPKQSANSTNAERKSSGRNAVSSRKRKPSTRKLKAWNQEEAVAKKNKQAEERLAEAESVKKSQFEMLERISGFTVDQAKEYMLKNLEDELTHEKAVRIMEFEQERRDEAEKTAREIISLAIQRCAADHVAEATISVVPLPNDEMKGRIIGREGRNIRTIENTDRR